MDRQISNSEANKNRILTILKYVGIAAILLALFWYGRKMLTKKIDTSELHIALATERRGNLTLLMLARLQGRRQLRTETAVIKAVCGIAKRHKRSAAQLRGLFRMSRLCYGAARRVDGSTSDPKPESSKTKPIGL